MPPQQRDYRNSLLGFGFYVSSGTWTEDPHACVHCKRFRSRATPSGQYVPLSDFLSVLFPTPTFPTLTSFSPLLSHHLLFLNFALVEFHLIFLTIHLYKWGQWLTWSFTSHENHVGQTPYMETLNIPKVSYKILLFYERLPLIQTIWNVCHL